MRQNPYVRICGGPGSATTLVYPTPRRLRCSSPQQARKSGDHAPLPVIRDRILTEVDVKQSPAQGPRVDGWALVSANRSRQASRGTAGEDDFRASPNLAYVEVAAEPVQRRQLVSTNGVCHRPHQPGSQGIVEDLGYVVAIDGTRHDQPERHVEGQVEELPIEALVVFDIRRQRPPRSRPADDAT